MAAKPPLSKFKDRIALYEDTENPLAPLTLQQQQFLLDLSHCEYQRPIPSNLKPIPVMPTVEVAKDSKITGVDWNKFNFKSQEEFSLWFLDVEKSLEDEEDAEVLDYLAALRLAKESTGGLLQEVTSVLDELKTLQDNYHFVSNKTNSLHNSCQQLIEEQTRLESTSSEMESHLSYFLKLDRITSKLQSSSLLITSDGFFTLLEQIDSCLSFMVHNTSFKESMTYTAKYKHCLHRAISLIKSHVTRVLQETTAEIRSSVQSEGGSKDTLFPLIYGKFSASIAKLKRLFTEVEERRNAWSEYSELFTELQEAFFRERQSLLDGSIRGMVEDLSVKGKLGHDLCSTVRLGASFCIHLSQDEFRLYGDFFSTSVTAHFDSFLERLCTPIYDTLRPLIIEVQHLETLAELCHIFRIELIEEQTTGNPLGLSSFLNILQQLLQDTQERLVYRASIYITSDIRNFSPAEGDLAYPQKLEMMEEIAVSLGPQVGTALKRSNSQISLASTTSLEVANINSQALQIPRPLKQATSPADLHGMWYPSVRRTLLCLSKLNRSLDKAIFQGLSQEALSACIANLSSAAHGISIRKTLVDGQLFEIKHLLILREQIAPFQVDFAVRETTLDFSRVKMAALSLLQKKKQMFSLSGNNALLEFIVDGTPQVKEYFLDSKKDVDRQLKATCELFITHATQLLIAPLQIFLQKTGKVAEAQKQKPEIRLGDQAFAQPALVSEVIQGTLENIKIKLPFLHRSMRLYLANRETEFILFRPIKNNVLNGFLELENILVVDFGGTVACPLQDHLNALLSSLLMADATS